MGTTRKHVLFIVFFFLFSFLGVAILDPDLGWRLQIGRLLLTSGVPKTDPFSFTMTQYPFVDHEWLTHIVLFFIYSAAGRIALSFVFGLIATAALFVVFRQVFIAKSDVTPFFNGALFLVGASLMGVAGVRPQVVGWLFLVLWVDELRRKNTRFLILFGLILFWVNTHGSFFLGVVTYFLFLCSRYLEKKWQKKDILSFFIMVVITGCNPYGFRIWNEVFTSLFDVSLRWRIQEWIPGVFVLDIAFWIYVAFFVSLLTKFWRFTRLFDRWLSVLFFCAALSSARNMPLFILVSVFPLIDLWKGFVKHVPREKKKALRVLSLTFALLFVFVGVVRIAKIASDLRPIESIYPERAIRFIKRNHAGRRIFAEYGWGGYIIWQLPDTKVFIDGRMPSWKWQQNNSRQSNSAEDEYEQIMLGKKPVELVQEKYTIEIAVVKPDKKKLFKRYKILYEDATSVVYLMQI